MATKTTKIEWTDKTWNPVTGCTKISQGCAHCYAETMTRRLNAMGLEKYANGFHVTLHDECLDEHSQLADALFVAEHGLVEFQGQWSAVDDSLEMRLGERLYHRDRRRILRV